MANHSVAIVGGSGFVGSALTKYLSAQFQVTVLDLEKPGDASVGFEHCDIRDRKDLVEKLRNFELIVNTAVVQLPTINEKRRLGYEVNVQGVQNVCEAVESSDSIKGLIHTSSWHVFGESDIRGVLDENFGFRPDKIEERAKLYALCKIAQESIIRIVAETSRKYYGILRLGTVLGENMPKLTAANIFIEKALHGEPMTPYKHTQHRPMLYVDIKDVCWALNSFSKIVLTKTIHEPTVKILNLVSPHPVTIIELAKIIRGTVFKLTKGKMTPRIDVVDKGIKSVYSAKDKDMFRVDVSRARGFLGLDKLIHPEESIERILRARIASNRLFKQS